LDLRLIFSVFVVIIMIFLAYWGTKWISLRYKHISNGKYIKVLERTIISQDKHLVLIQLGEKVYLLGVTGQNVETICTLDKDDLHEFKNTESTTDFNTIFRNLVKKQIPFIKKQIPLIKKQIPFFKNRNSDKSKENDEL
jgi:flagellar biosynthetic protein FliO